MYIIQLRKDESEYSHWLTQLAPMNCGDPITEEIQSANTTQMYTVKDLDPVTNYTVKVYALNTRNLTNEETVDIGTVAASM